MVQERTCILCGITFRNYPGKPGYITECTDCAKDIPLVGGNMIWYHKTAPELEIKSLVNAKRFAKLNKRNSHGPLSSIVEKKYGSEEKESSKNGSGTENRAIYNSPLGEKHSIKQ